MKEFRIIEPQKDGRNAFLIVFVFFLVVISANMTMYYLAYRSFDGLVEDNYYKRGLNYQDEKDQEARQKQLDWKVKFSHENNLFTISARDEKGNLIKKAKVKLVFFRPTQAGFDQSYNLKEIYPGVYKKPIKLPLPGIWDVFIEVQKEKSIWKKKQRINS